MDKKNLIIGVDLDGVCSDFYERMRELYAEWTETPLEEVPIAIDFNLNNWGIFERDQYESFHRFAVTQRDLFSTSPMIKGTRKYLRKLSDEGFRIRIVTHRLCIKFFHVLAIKQTVDWLDKNAIPYWDICFVKSKDHISADIYIEDTPHNVEALRKKGIYTICFGNNINKTVPQPRAESWEKVYKLIKEYEKENNERIINARV